MKVIKRNLGGFKELQILPLADLHIGDIHADGKKITEWLKYIEETENCFTILNGDLMNTAIRNSISFDYSGATPMEELQQCVKLFEPIREKVLCVTSGNHERRIEKETSLDSTLLFCEQLKIGDRYSPESALLFISFGKQSSDKHNYPMTYSIFCLHGSGGGKLEGSKINRMISLANIVDADIYLHSHVHSPAIIRNSYYRTFAPRRSIEKVDRLFINTSSALSWGGYGEIQGYKPNSLETPLLLLDGTKRGMKAVL